MLSQLLSLAERVLAVVATLPLALLAWIGDWLHFRALASRFPAPPTLPLVGNFFDCGLFPDAWTIIKWVLEDVMYRYPAGQILMGPVRLVLLSNVDDVQAFLMKTKNHSRPKIMEDFLAQCIGNGLATINGDKWSLHHQILKPTFHHNVLRSYVPVISRKSDIFVKLLTQHANGSAFDVKFMVQALAVDILHETFFGFPSNHQTKPNEALFENVLGGQVEICYRIGRPWLYLDAIYNLTPSGRKAREHLKWGRGFMSAAFEQRMKILRSEEKSLSRKQTVQTNPNSLVNHNATPTSKGEEGPKKRQFDILIDILLQKDGKSISHEEVIDEMVTLFMGGFDTTTITLQFAFYFLAKNPIVQEKAMQELRTIADAAGPLQLNAETLQRMQYVEMIVKETLRMHSPVFFFLNNAGVDTPLVSSDLVVPKGAIVGIAPRNMHMNPELYPDPHVFEPERFSPENCAKRHPCAYMPFGYGMRTCIGRRFAMLVLKIVISKIIWNYHILPDESYEPQLLWGITTTTTNGMRIKLVKRSTSDVINTHIPKHEN